MKLTRIFTPAPAILRGLGVLLAFRFISDNMGMNGVIEYSFVGILSTIAVSLSAGGAGNYLVGYFAKVKLFVFDDLYKVGQITLAGLLLLLAGAAVSIMYSRVTLVFPGLLWTSVICLVYIFASVASFCNSYFTGIHAERILLLSGVLASVFYILGLIFCYLIDSKILIFWAVLGFHFLNALTLFGFLLSRSSGFKIAKQEKGLIAIGDMMNVSMMSLSSGISNSIFVYGWLNGRGFSSQDFTVDLITIFRFTDVATMLVGPFIAIIVYPLLCGWSHTVDGAKKVFKFYLVVSFCCIIIFLLLFIIRNQISEIFFSRTIQLSDHLVIIFLLGEAMRLSLSVFGYAFIDARYVLHYFLIEILVKILIGAIVYNYANVVAVEVLFLFYFFVVLLVSIFASFFVRRKMNITS